MLNLYIFKQTESSENNYVKYQINQSLFKNSPFQPREKSFWSFPTKYKFQGSFFNVTHNNFNIFYSICNNIF